ncbi:MAG: hypothetical protein F6K03_09040, partial [Kamptonema sp. SIO4C4]|nr:hypothetical protein [Kamptonema sp. SIO4C4]
MKLDSLHQLVEKLTLQVNEVLTVHTAQPQFSMPEQPQLPEPQSLPSSSTPILPVEDVQWLEEAQLEEAQLEEAQLEEAQLEEAQPEEAQPMLDPEPMSVSYRDFKHQDLTHKDVLDDDESWEKLSDYHYHRDEQEFAPDLQVRRLTAQVTAAYHRIAALEEQLLAQRSGSDFHHS